MYILITHIIQIFLNFHDAHIYTNTYIKFNIMIIYIQMVLPKLIL